MFPDRWSKRRKEVIIENCFFTVKRALLMKHREAFVAEDWRRDEPLITTTTSTRTTATRRRRRGRRGRRGDWRWTLAIDQVVLVAVNTFFFVFLFVCCFWSGATQQKNGKRKERENGNEIHTIRHLWLIVEEREKGMKKDVFPLPDDWRRDFSSSLLVWPLLLSTSETPLSAGDGGNDPVSSSTGITKHMS